MSTRCSAALWSACCSLTLPFRIEPGTASSTLYLDSEERVGIGTAAPAEKLHVTGTDNPKVLIQDTADNANDKPALEVHP